MGILFSASMQQKVIPVDDVRVYKKSPFKTFYYFVFWLMFNFLSMILLIADEASIYILGVFVVIMCLRYTFRGLILLFSSDELLLTKETLTFGDKSIPWSDIKKIEDCDEGGLQLRYWTFIIEYGDKRKKRPFDIYRFILDSNTYNIVHHYITLRPYYFQGSYDDLRETVKDYYNKYGQNQ